MTSPPDNNTSSNSSEKMPLDTRQLSTLVDMESPEAVHNEVLHILGLINTEFDTAALSRVFRFTVDLFAGQLQEYKACNTYYHNLRHTTDTYLAMARLLHGALLSGENFRDREIFLGLTGALMHDSGMIQESCDSEGTGAKYTQEHVQLSMDFVTKHAASLHLNDQEITDLRDMILGTDLMVDFAAIIFSSSRVELMGKILGTADLIAQMFFEISAKRFNETLDNTCRHMLPHFKARWGINENLYIHSLENQCRFLEKVLADKNTSIYQELKRSNIVHMVRQKYGNTGRGE
jgi:hypothetical protein